MLKLLKSNLPALYARLAEKQDLYLPVRAAGKTNFTAWTEDAQVDLDTLKTVKSAKDAFFPQSENLYDCKTDEGKITITPEALRDKPFVVFGIKGCDVKGVEVLDKVFLSDPVDSYYAARRAHGILVSLACSRPAASCFCNVFGVDCTAPGGDVTVWLDAQNLYWQANTEKGEKLTAQLRDLLTEDDGTAVTAQQAATGEIVKKLPYSELSLDKWGADATANFDSPLWEQLYTPCLACGTCTFVCPTCQCYDIKDYNTGTSQKRYRCWDSCMYSDFTMMAHGNNRTSQMQRYRQRFMHKLCYYPANYGDFSCVGCGRCVDSCPTNLNIVKVIKAFQKEGS